MKSGKFNILVLDGGGSKGMYTLGVLKEIEKYIDKNLSQHFDLIYGTSTGSIIAALIAIGKSIEDIRSLYVKLIPDIMGKFTANGKSKILKSTGDKIFEGFDFTNLRTDIGIVALNNRTKEPFIFKSNILQAHGMLHSFNPGFGCSLTEAVLSSSAAYPIFKKVVVKTSNSEEVELVDGGFVANNASLYALIDAIKAFKINQQNIRLLNVGTGQFIEKPVLLQKITQTIPAVKFFTQVFTASTNTNAKLKDLVFPDVASVRINETFADIEINMVEKNINRLNEIYQLGRKSFGKKENEIRKLFE